MNAVIKTKKQEIKIGEVNSFEKIKQCVASCRIMSHSGSRNVLAIYDNEKVIAKLTFDKSVLSGIKCFDENNKKMLLVIFALKEVYSKDFWK